MDPDSIILSINDVQRIGIKQGKKGKGRSVSFISAKKSSGGRGRSKSKSPSRSKSKSKSPKKKAASSGGKSSKSSRGRSKSPKSQAATSSGKSPKSQAATSSGQPPKSSRSKSPKSQAATSSGQPPKSSRSKSPKSQATTSNGQPPKSSMSKSPKSQAATSSGQPPKSSMSKSPKSQAATSSGQPPKSSRSKSPDKKPSSLDSQQKLKRSESSSKLKQQQQQQSKLQKSTSYSDIRQQPASVTIVNTPPLQPYSTAVQPQPYTSPVFTGGIPVQTLPPLQPYPFVQTTSPLPPLQSYPPAQTTGVLPPLQPYPFAQTATSGSQQDVLTSQQRRDVATQLDVLERIMKTNEPGSMAYERALEEHTTLLNTVRITDPRRYNIADMKTRLMKRRALTPQAEQKLEMLDLAQSTRLKNMPDKDLESALLIGGEMDEYQLEPHYVVVKIDERGGYSILRLDFSKKQATVISVDPTLSRPNRSVVSLSEDTWDFITNFIADHPLVPEVKSRSMGDVFVKNNYALSSTTEEKIELLKKINSNLKKK